MKKNLFLVLLFFGILNSWSQTRISGVVVDSEGNPVPFVNVVFLNTSEGTTINEKGLSPYF